MEPAVGLQLDEELGEDVGLLEDDELRRERGRGKGRGSGEGAGGRGKGQGAGGRTPYINVLALEQGRIISLYETRKGRACAPRNKFRGLNPSWQGNLESFPLAPCSLLPAPCPLPLLVKNSIGNQETFNP